jgi:hypothetical protein
VRPRLGDTPLIRTEPAFERLVEHPQDVTDTLRAAMKIEHVPFQTIDWPSIARTEHPGAPGVAYWQTREVGNVRVRIVEYEPGYVADHWCERGHVVHVLAGELVTELRDGRRFVLAAGQSYVVADGDGAHRSSTQTGARLLIVD